jgi:hypothetical protein
MTKTTNLTDYSALTPDRETPEVITATYEIIRGIEGYLYVFNVFENLLRRLNRVLSVTIVRRPRTDSDPTTTLLVDILSALPGLSPGPDHRWVVLGDARVGAEWRRATTLGEPSLSVALGSQEDLAGWLSVPLGGWGLTERDEREDIEAAHESVNVAEQNSEDKYDDHVNSGTANDDGRWYQDRWLLTLHPR